MSWLPAGLAVVLNTVALQKHLGDLLNCRLLGLFQTFWIGTKNWYCYHIPQGICFEENIFADMDRRFLRGYLVPNCAFGITCASCTCSTALADKAGKRV
jgi:hypothetical protein